MRRRGAYGDINKFHKLGNCKQASNKSIIAKYSILTMLSEVSFKENFIGES